MRHFCNAVLALALALPLSAGAQADPGVAVQVVAVPAQVSLSRAPDKSNLPLITYAAYRVTLSNNTTNTLNRLFFNATATNAGSSEAVLFDSALPGATSCPGLGTSTVACALGSLAAGSSTQFHVVVRAPQTGTRIDLNWRAGGFEGNGGGNGCCSTPGLASTGLIDPATDPLFTTEVVSFVKPSGGTLFTGAEAVSTTADGWTTIVKVPAFTSLPQTTATVIETSIAGSCQPYALAGGCFSSDLTIPGTFASLDITIRWDKAFFSLGRTKAEDVKLFYTGSNSAITYPIQLALCSADASIYSSAPLPGRPCFDTAPKKLGKEDTANKELWGDLQFRVRALDNGSYAN
jgi:hypothetical protein